MNRQALKLPFTLDSAPEWQCPTCQAAFLRIKKESFQKEERRHSRDHSHEAWEPEWIEYVYSCLLVCSNDQCKEVVASTGVGSVDSYGYEDEQTGELTEEYDDFFQPKHFEPHLELLSIPEKCPDSVSAPLRDSFRLFFSAPSAASNSVRIAIEELLTELKVKRFNVVKGQRRFISLHQRISLLPAKFAHLKETLI